MKDLISIVVPIYKVEQYLRQCLDSICLQSYNNIEIILVDDGSPDRCGKICDEYAEKDSRIQVIHKVNGGLSDARNAGIDIATGKYIAFVDSDDWIEKTMFENLYNTALKEQADIVCCGRYLTDGEHVFSQNFMSNSRSYNRQDAIEEILLGKSLDVAAWDKLYAKELFDGIRFPVGENNEDIATFYKLIAKANKIAHSGTCEYYYRNRADSITKIKYRERDCKIIIKNIDELELFLKKNYPFILPALQRYRALNVYCLLNKYIKSNGKDNSSEYKFLLNMFKQVKKYFYSDEMIPKKEKMIAILTEMGGYDLYLNIKQKVSGRR